MEEKLSDTYQRAAPDGPGVSGGFRPISTQAAHDRLLQKTNIDVDEKDPLMAEVELHAAFCEDQQLLLERHEKAVSKAMSAVVGELHQKMREETEVFSRAVNALASDSTRDTLREVTKSLDAHQRVLFVTTLANVSVSVLMFGIALCVLVLRLR